MIAFPEKGQNEIFWVLKKTYHEKCKATMDLLLFAVHCLLKILNEVNFIEISYITYNSYDRSYHMPTAALNISEVLLGGTKIFKYMRPS